MKELNALIDKYKDYFPDQDSIDSTQKKVANLNTCFQTNGSTYFVPQDDAFAQGKEFHRVHINAYRQLDHRPSLPLLAERLADALCINKSSADYEALLLVAFRAEMGQSDPAPAYHNPHHFADVAVMTATYLQNTPSLTLHEKALALIAAFGHDIDHEGRPNPTDNLVFNEEKSFTGMQPLLEATGMSQEDQQKIHVILLTTSINGPLATLKSIAIGKTTDLSKFPELKVLLTDGALTEMAAIVTDADIYAASGAGFEASHVMSKLLTQETESYGGTLDFVPDSSRLYFLTNVIGEEGYLSQAARKFSNPAFERLLEETRLRLKLTDPKEGYPPAFK